MILYAFLTLDLVSCSDRQRSVFEKWLEYYDFEKSDDVSTTWTFSGLGLNRFVFKGRIVQMLLNIKSHAKVRRLKYGLIVSSERPLFGAL